MKYSTYQFEVKKILKQINQYGIKKSFIEVINSLPMNYDIQYELPRLLSEKAILEGNGLNIFIKGQTFFDFLLKTPIRTKIDFPKVIENKLTNNCPNFIKKETGSDYVNIYFDGEKPVIQKKLEKMYYGIVHHNSKLYPSFLFHIKFFNDSFITTYAMADEYGITGLMKNDVDFNSVYNESENCEHTYDPIKKINIKNTYDFSDWNRLNHVFMNLLLYCNVFPDKVLNGVPDDFERSRFDKSSYLKSISIKLDESLIDNRSITPHFRSGHFAKLESERYVNKRGQIIWVSESMVKGFVAKTVVE